MKKYVVTTREQGCVIFADGPEEALAEFSRLNPYCYCPSGGGQRRTVYIYCFADNSMVLAFQTADEDGKFPLTYDKDLSVLDSTTKENE